MSRAFTKEIDDAPPPPPEERTMSNAPNLVTARGAWLIEAEIAALDGQIEHVGDSALTALQRDLRYWAARRATMQVVAAVADPNQVGFGTKVSIRRGGKLMTLTIVGEDEADPAAGLLAWTSPLARALDAAEAGEVVAFEAGGRHEDIEVVAIAAAS